MKRRLLAPVLAAVVLLVLTSAVAFANVTDLRVSTNPTSVGKIAIATGTVSCTAGHPVEVDVTITKHGVQGFGETFLRCNGEEQHWTVNVFRDQGKWGVGRASEYVSAHDAKDNTFLTQSVNVFLVAP